VLAMKQDFLPMHPALFIFSCRFQRAWKETCPAVAALFVCVPLLHFPILVPG